VNFNDSTIIDNFLATFAMYIDSGFGLLNGEVINLTSILIALDITLAGLFWALDGTGIALARFIRKVLYIGAFTYILNNFSILTAAIFNSFAGLGLAATNNAQTAADLLHPGKLARIGFQAAGPLLHQASTMIGFTNFFDNIITVIVLLFAWFVVVLAFFILAVQLFITILEFKLISLAGFVLVPFAFWNKSAFLAERVLGNVISSGIKVMVLAVIVGIGSGFFSSFTNALNGQDPNFAQAMSLVLAAISLFGLGIFGPAIAAGLVSGAPQLGAGAAVGTVGGVAAATFLTGSAAIGGSRLAIRGGMAAIRAGTSLGAGAATAYSLGQSTAPGASGMSRMASGVGGVARAGAGMVGKRVSSVFRSARDTLAADAQAGSQAAWRATGGSGRAASVAPAEASNATPPWARSLRSERQRHAQAHAHAALQAVKDGDRPAAAANPDLNQEER